MQLRKTLILRETVETDETGVANRPITRVVAMAVVQNPAAGRQLDDLSPLFDIGAAVGRRLAADAVAALAGAPVSYGKAAIVGSDGEVEHGGAMVHPRLGAPLRDAVGGGAALIPANVKVGGIGTPVDLPLGHKDDAWSFDHIDTMTVMVGDAPRADEIVVCIAVADGPRARPRVGRGPGKPARQ